MGFDCTIRKFHISVKCVDQVDSWRPMSYGDVTLYRWVFC